MIPSSCWFFLALRLELVPLLRDLAGGAAAFDTRFAEMSRQSLLAREMVEGEISRWEEENLRGEKLGRRVEEFPLKAFVRRGDERVDIPELVREELLHRFVTGEDIFPPLKKSKTFFVLFGGFSQLQYSLVFL